MNTFSHCTYLQEQGTILQFYFYFKFYTKSFVFFRRNNLIKLCRIIMSDEIPSIGIIYSGREL